MFFVERSHLEALAYVTSARADDKFPPDVSSLLRAHGIEAPEQDFPSNGYSGARMRALVQNGERYVLKRVRFEDDWIMRVTGDTDAREVQFAVSPLSAQLPQGVRVPSLGAGRDDDSWALLMRDISTFMLPPDGVVTSEIVDLVLDRLAAMHATFWGRDLTDADVQLDYIEKRLQMLGPGTMQQLVDEGRDFGGMRGWELFDHLAPPDASSLVRRLFADPAPLLRLLDSLPQTLLHGDGKFGNIGIDGGTLWLIDWALVLRAPVAVELAWFLSVNSSRLPLSLDETVDRYRAALERQLGPKRWPEARWDVQTPAVHICGLMMYGWGKALDAESGDGAELAWWCERAVEGSRLLHW